MQKRGISQVITTVLIVLLVLAAVVVVWQAVKHTVEEGTDDVSVDIFATELKVKERSVYINYTDNKCQLAVSRGADSATLSAVKIVLLGTEAGGTTDKIYTITDKIPQSLEYKTYTLDSTALNPIEKITVYPVSKDGRIGLGDEYIVRLTDERNPSGGWAEDPPRTPDSTACSDLCTAGQTQCGGTDNRFEETCEDHDGDGCLEFGGGDDCADCSCQCGGYGVTEVGAALCSDGKDNDCVDGQDSSDTKCQGSVVQLSGCEELNQPNTLYVLSTGFTDNTLGGGDACFRITADDVVLDCGSHANSVKTSAEYGVYTDRSYSGIKRCNLSGASYGVYGNSAYSLSVQNNILKNHYDGIYVEYSEDVSIEENDLSFSANNGIYLTSLYGSSNQIQRNNLSHSGYGIYLEYSPNSNLYVESNNLDRCSSAGVYLMDFLNAEFYYNNITYAGHAWGSGYAIEAYNANNTYISDNNLSHSFNGVSLSYSDSSSIYQNSINRCNQTGIGVYDSSGPTIESNDVTNTKDQWGSGYGIYVSYSDYSYVNYNNVSKSGSYGIYISGSDYAELRSNIANGNGYIGIELYESNYSRLEYNDVSYNGYAGLNAYLVSASQIANNNFYNNSNYGMYFSSCYFNSPSYTGTSGISGNYISGSGTVGSGDNAGIYLSSSDYNEFYDNEVYLTVEGTGIYLDYSKGNSLHYNTINHNEEYGIYVYDEADTLMDSNTACDNNYYNLYCQDYPIGAGANSGLSPNTFNDPAQDKVYECSSNSWPGAGELSDCP